MRETSGIEPGSNCTVQGSLWRFLSSATARNATRINTGPDYCEKVAHATFLEKLFADSAASLGYARSGMKEVRLDIGHARYLKWLFQKARFVFLYRDPYAAYRSYRVFPMGWPDRPALSARDLAHHWLRLTDGFLLVGESDSLLLSHEALPVVPRGSHRTALRIHRGRP